MSESAGREASWNLTEVIERALLDADAFVLARGEADKTPGAFVNPLADSPLRQQIGDALVALGAVRYASYSLLAVPSGNDYRANRYDTDNAYALHLWDSHGRSFDVRLPKLNPEPTLSPSTTTCETRSPDGDGQANGHAFDGAVSQPKCVEVEAGSEPAESHQSNSEVGVPARTPGRDPP